MRLLVNKWKTDTQEFLKHLSETKYGSKCFNSKSSLLNNDIFIGEKQMRNHYYKTLLQEVKL